ncbi:MAG: metal ABC transporter permease [Paracoccus sp. (in: a-proteobacteria)]|nr:metal ABC transporter permease [Paracoccus sp. (in: a-proteobacteria)]
MILLEPFAYSYMTNAICVSALVGLVCGFLSAFLILKGWSLIGDALSHAILPGVAGAYILGLPFALGAFLSGGLAALTMLFLGGQSGLRQDAVIGIIFTAFFGLGLFMISIYPMSVSLQTIVMGNVLTISPGDMWQLVVISAVSLAVLLMTWRNLLAVFFDETHAVSIGLHTTRLKVMFFMLLAGCTVAAMQTVGALLVVALVITPGATAYLLTDRFGRLIAIAAALGAVTSGLGAYLSYFLDGATGGVIVLLQTAVFVAALIFAPVHGLRAEAARSRKGGA